MMHRHAVSHDRNFSRVGAGYRNVRPSVARGLVSTADAIHEVLVEGYVSPEQEALEDAHLEARIAQWDADAKREQEDDCYLRRFEDADFFSLAWTYDDEEDAYLREQAEINRVWDAMSTVRAWINTRVV